MALPLNDSVPPLLSDIALHLLLMAGCCCLLKRVTICYWLCLLHDNALILTDNMLLLLTIVHFIQRQSAPTVFSKLLRAGNANFLFTNRLTDLNFCYKEAFFS